MAGASRPRAEARRLSYDRPVISAPIPSDIVRLDVSSVAKWWRKLSGQIAAETRGETSVRSGDPHRIHPLAQPVATEPNSPVDQTHEPGLEHPLEQPVADEPEDTRDERGREPVPGVTLICSFAGHKSAIRSVAFDPDGLTLASGSSDSTIKLWDLSRAKLLNTLEGQFKNTVFSVAFDFDGSSLVSGTDKGLVEQRDSNSGELFRTLERQSSGAVFSVATDSQGRRIAAGTDRGFIELWETINGKRLRMLDGHVESVYSVAFDPEGSRLVSGGNDKTIRLWDVNRGRLLRTINGHTGTVRSVVFDPTGLMLASGSSDTTIKLWDASNGEMLCSLTGHTNRVEAVAYSYDGRLLASKCRAGTIRIWNCETWETVAIIPEPTFSKWWIPSLAFHPTLPLLATAGSMPETPAALRSRVVHLWELDVDLLLSNQVSDPTARDTNSNAESIGDITVDQPGDGLRANQQASSSKELNIRTECLDL